MSYLLFFKRLTLEEDDNEQIKLVNKLKGIDKGVKPVEKTDLPARNF